MTKPKVISFDEWLKSRTDEEQEKLKCPDCNGSGNCSCHCGDEHECGTCDGTGKSDEGRDLQDEYRKVIEADLKKWEEWNRRAA